MAGEITLPAVDVQGAAPPPEAPAPAAGGGTAFLAPGGKLAVTNPDGSIGLIEQADAQDALAQGLRPATQGELDREQMGVGGQVASAVIGAGRGVTAGLSDPLIVGGARLLGGNESAEEYRQVLNRAKNANPVESFGGEIAGSLLGMYLLPGSAAARGGIASESMLARGAVRFAEAAPRAALEGLALGVGQQASEDTLGNHQANAEKYLVSGAKGLIFGGLLGGGLHALGGGIADKARGYLGRGASEGAELATAGAPYRALAKDGEAAAAKGGALDFLAHTAEEKAFKATGAKIRDIQKLGTTAEAQSTRQQRIGRTLLDEGIVTGTASQETIAQRLTAKVRVVGEDLSAMRAKLDTATARPSTEAIVKRVNAEVLAPLERLPGTQAEAAAVRSYMDDFAVKAGERPDFKTLHEFRRALDDKLDPKLWAKIPGTATPAAQEFGAVRGILEDEFTAAGERAAKELGDTFAAKYGLAKTLYSDLKTAEKIIVKEVARGGANRSISLTDTIAGVGGLVAGGPLGLAAAIGNKAMRTYGDQFAASVLDKATRLQAVQRAAAKIDDAIAGGVRGFLSGERSAAAAKPPPKITAEEVAKIREATRDPQALTAHVAAMLATTGLKDAAPRTAQAAAITAMRVMSYLRDKVPKEPAPTSVTFGQQRARAPSAVETARFAQAVEVANDPMTVVEDMRAGRLSREKVEALRVCYPEIYGAIRAEIAKSATELQPKLTQQQEVAMSILFDTPVAAVMQPKNIRAFNESFAQSAPDPTQSSGQGAPQPTARGLARKGSLASGFDKQEAPS